MTKTAATIKNTAYELLENVRKIFTQTHTQDHENRPQVTLKNGKIIDPKSYGIEGRLADRITSETLSFLTKDPNSIPTLKEKMQGVAQEISDRLSELKLRRYGGTDLFTKKHRILCVPVVDHIIQLSYAKVLKAKDIAVPDYDNNKDQVKEIIRDTLTKYLSPEAEIKTDVDAIPSGPRGVQPNKGSDTEVNKGVEEKWADNIETDNVEKSARFTSR